MFYNGKRSCQQSKGLKCSQQVGLIFKVPRSTTTNNAKCSSYARRPRSLAFTPVSSCFLASWPDCSKGSSTVVRYLIKEILLKTTRNSSYFDTILNSNRDTLWFALWLCRWSILQRSQSCAPQLTWVRITPWHNILSETPVAQKKRALFGNKQQ